MVSGKKILKCFTIYGHGNHLGHVTCKMLMILSQDSVYAEAVDSFEYNQGDKDC